MTSRIALTVCISLLVAGVVVVSPATGVRSSGATDATVNAPPATCRMPAQVVFWTSTDWELLGEELKAQLSPCADYYISIPPLSNDKTGLRAQQDDVIRALGPQFHPLAEVTLGNVTGWASWVTGAPGRTWFDAGVEFRRRMVQAGYRPELGETWLLNELDRSTIRDKPPYSRAAMKDLLRGLNEGDGSGPKLPGIVEIGIAYTHQNIPDVEAYKTEMRAWLEDSEFWTSVAPAISMLTKEVYPDARFWGIGGTTLNQRARHLTQYMEHPMNLVNAGPANIGAARSVFTKVYTPLGNATWPARGPDPYTPPFCCGHGWTLMPLDAMQAFVSEQIYATRRYVGNHRQGSPKGRLGFSWQPTNNFDLPPAEWESAKRAIASRIGEAIRFAYRPGLVNSIGACRPPGSSSDWCQGADISGAAFTEAWTMFEHWS